jgi:hypothetical protein
MRRSFTFQLVLLFHSQHMHYPNKRLVFVYILPSLLHTILCIIHIITLIYADLNMLACNTIKAFKFISNFLTQYFQENFYEYGF